MTLGKTTKKSQTKKILCTNYICFKEKNTLFLGPIGPKIGPLKG